jgi:hypothetical protein
MKVTTDKLVRIMPLDIIYGVWLAHMQKIVILSPYYCFSKDFHGTLDVNLKRLESVMPLGRQQSLGHEEIEESWTETRRGKVPLFSVSCFRWNGFPVSGS